MINKVTLIGRVGKEPTVRYTNDDRAIASLSIATSESWKDKNGDKQEKTEWHSVVIFGTTATFVEKYVNKGDLVYIEGKLTTRKWQDKDGSDKYSTEVVIDVKGQLQKLSYSEKETARENSTIEPSQTPQSDDVFGDSIPF